MTGFDINEAMDQLAMASHMHEHVLMRSCLDERFAVVVRDEGGMRGQKDMWRRHA